MSAHTSECVYVADDKAWLAPAPEGCAAPEEHTAAPLEACCGDAGCDGASCAPPPDPITIDEARAVVAGAIMASLRKSIAEAEMLTEGAPTETEKKNGALYVMAGKELYTSLKVMKARFERPRILRPERGAKVVRR